MDFGRLGSIVDASTGKKRTVWALLVVLPYSHHCFVWPLLQQTLIESVTGLEAAWRFFGGVPKRLIIDNFSVAIAGPDALAPRPTGGFLEYSRARGFLSDPARVRRPKDKPDPDDYPQEKTAYALRAPDRVVQRDCELGPSVETFARRLFDVPLRWAKLRQGQKLLSLGEKYTASRLDAACARPLDYDLIDVRRRQRILLQAIGRDEQPHDEPGALLGSRLARPGSAFDHRQREVAGSASSQTSWRCSSGSSWAR